VPPARAVARVLFVLVFALSAALLLLTAYWSASTMASRPPDGAEGEIAFEAARIARGLPLYVDPAIGAGEYGPPPSRYFVLYPPLWPALLSRLPASLLDRNVVGSRAIAFALWFGTLGLLVARAEPRCRRVAALVAVFLGSTWVLALFATSGRPDALAVLLAAIAAERSVRKGRVDPLAGALFALAAWTKPNVLGLAAGAFAGQVWVSRRGVVAPALAGLATSGVIACILHVTSGGAWLGHLVASTGQPLDLGLWLGQIGDRLPFFGPTMLAAGALAVSRRADDRAKIAAGAVVATAAWALFSLAKIGSASNYWLEPSVAALVCFARFEVPERLRRSLAVAGACAAQLGWNGVASAQASIRGIASAPAKAAVLARAREACGAKPTDVVVADEPGIELVVEGRMVQTPFQTTHLVRRGRFSEATWIADLSRPEVRCLVMQSDLVERPVEEVSVPYDCFTPGVRAHLKRTFSLTKSEAGIYIYRRSP
jgi:hypothetical protein